MRRSFVHASAGLALVIAACASGAGVLAGGGADPAAGSPAVRFAPGIVSTGDVFASTFTPDGRTVVFTKFSPPKPMTLMISEWRDNQWTTPRPLPFSGRYRDLDPSFAPDGRRLYFSSLRPVGPSPGDTASGVDTWYVDRDGDRWGTPVRLAEPVNGNEVDMYPSVTRRGVVYFDSRRSRNQRLVYRAEPRADGSFAEPQLLDATINADSGASNLFVDPDERYVVFGAVRPEGRGGMDLYFSVRTASGWSTPRNLGPLVNTDATEFCPFVSRDGRFLYFTRISPIGSGQVERNIYVVRFDAIRAQLAGAANDGEDGAALTGSAPTSTAGAASVDDSLTSAAWLATLPDGEEKRRFIVDCTGCHQFDERIASTAGRLNTAQEWEAAITRMLGYGGATTAFPVISSYRDARRTAAWLTVNVTRPRSEPRRAAPGAGTLREYLMPVAQDLPHDVAVDADGKVLVTGMFTHKMYRLDPATGSIADVDIPVARANPRAVEIAPNGDWWIVLGGPHQLARYRPSTKEWRTFDVGVYPHSLALASDGRVWFNGHFTHDPEIIGYVDSLGVHRVELPSHPTLASDPGGPIPYEIRAAPDGRIWTSELQGNRVVVHDPATQRSRAYDMPVAHSGPRRFDIDARGVLWIPAYSGNALVRLDPSSGSARNIPLPVADAVPYVVRVHPRTGIVWVAASASDDLLAFDPRTERFTLYRLARGAMVRHMAFDPRSNDVWLAYGESPGMPARVARLQVSEK